MAVLSAHDRFVRRNISGPVSTKWRRGRLTRTRSAALSGLQHLGRLRALFAENGLAREACGFLSAAQTFNLAVAGGDGIGGRAGHHFKSCLAGGAGHAYLPVGWLWFLGTLVPVIGLVQVGGAAMADRYTYFPLVGVFLVVAFGFCDLASRFSIPPKGRRSRRRHGPGGLSDPPKTSCATGKTAKHFLLMRSR